MGTVSLFTSSTSSYSSLSNTTSAQQKTQQAETQSSDQQDTVKLSETAQAKMLYKQGQSVSTIAASLGTSASAINADLGLTLEKALTKAIESSVQA
ncbi:MAG: hypothetical protein P4K83_06880 [Terracidiphilus sp.]|nr:hypothetical protein [Terracidiphilus sp.]